MLTRASDAQANFGVPPWLEQEHARQAAAAAQSTTDQTQPVPTAPSAAAARSEATENPGHAATPETGGGSGGAASPGQGAPAAQTRAGGAATAAADLPAPGTPGSAGQAPLNAHEKAAAAQSKNSSGAGSAPALPGGAARGAGQGGPVGGSPPLGLGGSLAPRRARRGPSETPEGLAGGLPARPNPGGRAGSRAAAPAQAHRGPAAARGADPEVEDIPMPAGRARGGPQQEAGPPDLGALFSSLLGGDGSGGGGGGGAPAGGGAGLEGVLGRMLQSPAMGQLVSQIAQPAQAQQPGGRAQPGGSDFGALMQQMMPLVSSVSARPLVHDEPRPACKHVTVQCARQ